ncbi:MAG: LamG domain-containing protein, partial [Alphaproteobacteria bacterium]|nr:LamG domain-containing protein [Alphaproteobacteria bacterium]
MIDDHGSGVAVVSVIRNGGFRRLRKFALCILAVTTVLAGNSRNSASQDLKVLHLKLDGSLTDSSTYRNDGAQPKNSDRPLTWSRRGKTSRALALDGKLPVFVSFNRTLEPGDSSWSISFWIRPRASEEQPLHAGLVSSYFGDGRAYGVKLSKGKLRAFFYADRSNRAEAASIPLDGRIRNSINLFDGAWHHVTAVLDRRWDGEIRLYVDGRNVTAKVAVQPHSIVTEA